MHKLKDTLNQYSTITPLEFDHFVNRAKEEGYKIAFLDDPTEFFDWVGKIHGDPGVSINSSMEDTIRGFLPFQAQGVNFAKLSERATVAQYSTGTGKTVLACGLIKWCIEQDEVDVV